MLEAPTTPPQRTSGLASGPGIATGNELPSSARSTRSAVDSGIGGVFDSPAPKVRLDGFNPGTGRVVSPEHERKRSTVERPFASSNGEDESNGNIAARFDAMSPSNGPMTKEMLSENPFENEYSRILFEAIDELQSWGSSKYLKIPQLVIVGNQSSGKSSLLQTLTQIPFPVQDGCCTRFPTRIVSKHSQPGSPNHYRITIEKPDEKQPTLRLANPGASDYVQEGETLDLKEFSRILEEVSRDYMGISENKDANSKNFVANVLRVELSGSERSHFSILDLPGIFASDHDVSAGEMEGVNNMVIEYMKQEENIVICVVDGSHDINNQGIFKLALEHVRDKERLVGVFTKCDIASGRGKEVLKAAGGELGSNKRMPNGWFVVRNRGSEESLELDTASEEDALFSKYPWTDVPSVRRGSAALKVHLGVRLATKIGEVFPAIKDNINLQLSKMIEETESLGPPRETRAEKQQYLVRFVQEFSNRAKLALTQPGFLENKKMELRRNIRKLNDEFDVFMRTKGHVWEFKDQDVDPGANFLQVLVKSSSPEKTPVATEIKPFKSPNAFKKFENPETSEALDGMIATQLARFQANQLPGIVNPDIYPSVFNMQARKWASISTTHLIRARNAVSSCVEEILESICPSQGPASILHRELGQVVTRMLEVTYDEAMDRLNTYCLRETTRTMLQTANPLFGKQLLDWRKWRFLAATTEYRRTKTGDDVGDLQRLFTMMHPSIAENMSQDVHDVLKVYYQLTLESFIHHITSIIVENFVSHEQGPLSRLNPTLIIGLSDDDITRLAREDEGTAKRRIVLSKDIVRLEGARAIAERAEARTRGLSVA